MKPLIYEQTRYSPKVVFDANAQVYEIQGTLMLEDNKVFFQTINRWWRAYQQNPHAHTKVICNLSFYTLATDNFFMQWFSVLKDTPNVQVIWYYDPSNWDMTEYATTYAENYKFIQLVEQSNK